VGIFGRIFGQNKAAEKVESPLPSFNDHLARCRIVTSAEVVNRNAATRCALEGVRLVDELSPVDQQRYLNILGTPHQMGETKEVMREWLRRHIAAVEAVKHEG